MCFSELSIWRCCKLCSVVTAVSVQQRMKFIHNILQIVAGHQTRWNTPRRILKCHASRAPLEAYINLPVKTSLPLDRRHCSAIIQKRNNQVLCLLSLLLSKVFTKAFNAVNPRLLKAHSHNGDCHIACLFPLCCIRAPICSSGLVPLCPPLTLKDISAVYVAMGFPRSSLSSAHFNNSTQRTVLHLLLALAQNYKQSSHVSLFRRLPKHQKYVKSEAWKLRGV
jgi:hypothetical protein